MLSDQLIILLPLAYLALQIAALRWMPEGWVRAAMVPAVAMVLALLFFAAAMIVNATVAPLGLTLGLPAATLYLTILWLAYGVVALRRPA